MFTPCNACPACPARPVECETYSSGVGQNGRTGACPACPVAPEDGTGVGSGNPTEVNSSSACLLPKNDRIGRARLDLVDQGHVNPLGLSSEFRIPSSEFGNAPCSMHHACRSTGVRPFFKQVSHKAP